MHPVISGTRILVVEDEAVVAKDLQQRLRKLGYEVPVTVATGESAITQAVELRPNLILMDVRLKGEMDGIEAATQIRLSSEIPIIFLTAYADVNTVDRAKITEPFGYILKPFAERELHTSIQVALYKHQIESSLRRSERWLTATLRAISDAVIAVNSQSEVVFMNPVAEALTGYSEREVAGMNIAEAFITNRRPDENGRTAFIAIGSDPSQLNEEAILISKDGKRLPIEESAAPIRDEKGAIAGEVRVFRDITGRKRAEDALRVSEERFRLLVDGVKDYGIVILDAGGNVVSWNSGSERINGYRAEEIIGKPFSCFYQPEDVAAGKPQEALLKAAERGSYPDDGWRVRKNGSRFCAETVITPLRSKTNELTGYSMLTRDITERRQSDERFRQTQKLESLGVLAGGVAHDFNNLLVGILGNTSLALETLSTNNPARGMLKDVLAASETAANLTRQLLAYAGKGRFIVEPIDLSALVKEIGTLIQATIPKNVQLRLELEGKLPCVDADAGQLQQLTMNLVINAAEAIGPDQSGSVLVTTSTQEVDAYYMTTMPSSAHIVPGKYVTLEIHDNGVGMSEETISKIFDPFFTTKFTGRGLGLAAVLGIVRGHKGAIRVYSTPGRGTTFKILFPTTEDQPAKPRFVPTMTHDKAGTTILVVDDEEVVRRTAKAMLERYGYSVITAENGKQAVDLYKVLSDKVGAILLDMTMPVMSGEETFRELKAIRPDLRVVLTSGYNEIEAVQRFSGKGLAGFIQKPYNALQLAEKIRTILQSDQDQERVRASL